MANFKLAKKDALSDTRTNIYNLHEKKLEYFEKMSTDTTIKRDFILTYSDVFGTSKISVVQVYPGGGANYTLYNVTPQKSKKIKRNFLPVIIRDSESDLNKYGYLEIETYQ